MQDFLHLHVDVISPSHITCKVGNQVDMHWLWIAVLNLVAERKRERTDNLKEHAPATGFKRVSRTDLGYYRGVSTMEELLVPIS